MQHHCIRLPREADRLCPCRKSPSQSWHPAPSTALKPLQLPGDVCRHFRTCGRERRRYNGNHAVGQSSGHPDYRSRSSPAGPLRPRPCFAADARTVRTGSCKHRIWTHKAGIDRFCRVLARDFQPWTGCNPDLRARAGGRRSPNRKGSLCRAGRYRARQIGSTHACEPRRRDRSAGAVPRTSARGSLRGNTQVASQGCTGRDRSSRLVRIPTERARFPPEPSEPRLVCRLIRHRRSGCAHG